jgi:hypothetical protein
MVARIYAKAGLAFTSAARAEIAAHLEANPRCEHGRVVYDLAADFGLAPADVRKRFDAYLERFPVRVED